MFRGDRINVTEDRSVLHVALRMPKGESLIVDGVDVVAGGARGARPHVGVRRPRPLGRVEGPHGQADPQRRQHRHRRLRPRTGDGLRGAAPLLAPRPDVPLRLQRRLDRLRRGDPRPRRRGDAVHHLLQDLHDARDDDQRPDGARVGAGRARATSRRSRSTSSPSRRTPRRCRSSASTPTTCSASGTGSAAATRWTRRSASRRCSRSGPTRSARCSPGSTRWTSTSARRRSSETCRC